ncbi:MAG: hypothetical protein ABII79_01070 [bacterium]
MEISEFTFRLILLFLPGLIAFLLVDKLTDHKPYQLWWYLFGSLLLGFVCYLVYYPITLIPFLRLEFTFLDNLTSTRAVLDYWEILITTVLAIPIGLFLAFADRKQYLYGFAEWLGVCDRHGNVDTWSHILNSEEVPNVIFVRDLEYDLLYYGQIDTYSDCGEPDEIFLVDVTVYQQSTGDKLYDTPALYLARSRNKIMLEFPDFQAVENPKK